MLKKIIYIILPLYCVLFSSSVFAKHLYREKIYQNFWAIHNGAISTEYVLPDKTRVDIITNEYAIEVDFAQKWAESVGQSLYYSTMTGLKPGIVLIVEDVKDYRFVFRVEILTKKYGIKLWIIKPEDLNIKYK